MPASTDQNAIDLLIHQFFGAFDNREGRVPDDLALIALFTDKAVVARQVDGQCELYSAEEFARPRIALLRSDEFSQFHEQEDSSVTKIVGDIATRSSRYTKFGRRRGNDYGGRGTKFFHLAKLLGSWRIVSLLWTDDVDN